MNKLLYLILLNKLSKEKKGINPTGTINITLNGEIDVTEYATANVNVEFTVYELPDHIKFGGSKVFPSDFNTTNMTDFYYFLSSSDLKTLHQINTENVTNMERAFNDCVNLEDFPVLNGSKVTNFRNTFSNCNKLTNDSLNNILEMLKNATVYNASNNTKTLKWIGLSSTQATTCTTLSNRAACETAGWTTGY